MQLVRSTNSCRQPLLELFSPRARNFDFHSVLQLYVAIAARRFEQGVHAIELNDRRTMDAKESPRVELILQILHRFANEMLAIADDELGVRAAGHDVVDIRHGDKANFSA